MSNTKTNFQKKFLLIPKKDRLMIGLYVKGVGWEYYINIRRLLFQEMQSSYDLTCLNENWSSLTRLQDVFEILSTLENKNKNPKDFQPIIELLEQAGYTELV